MEETLNRINNEPKQSNNQANVSSTIIRGEGKRVITEDYIPQEYQGFDEPINTIDDEPINTVLPDDKPIGYNATTADRALQRAEEGRAEYFRRLMRMTGSARSAKKR